MPCDTPIGFPRNLLVDCKDRFTPYIHFLNISYTMKTLRNVAHFMPSSICPFPYFATKDLFYPRVCEELLICCLFSFLITLLAPQPQIEHRILRFGGILVSWCLGGRPSASNRLTPELLTLFGDAGNYDDD